MENGLRTTWVWSSFRALPSIATKVFRPHLLHAHETATNYNHRTSKFIHDQQFPFYVLSSLSMYSHLRSMTSLTFKQMLIRSRNGVSNMLFTIIGSFVKVPSKFHRGSTLRTSAVTPYWINVNEISHRNTFLLEKQMDRRQRAQLALVN